MIPVFDQFYRPMIPSIALLEMFLEKLVLGTRG